MFDYHLVFKDSSEAEQVIQKAIKNLKPFQYVVHTIGELVEYIHDEEDLEAIPQKVILAEGWFVDVRCRLELKELEAYKNNLSDQPHNFS